MRTPKMQSSKLLQFVVAIWLDWLDYPGDIVEVSLQWRFNGRDVVSNHQPQDCLLNVYSGVDQRKHQSSASLAFVWGIHRWSVDSPHKGPVTRRMFPFDDVIMVPMQFWGLCPTNAMWCCPFFYYNEMWRLPFWSVLEIMGCYHH